jgi:hypothetical protein
MDTTLPPLRRHTGNTAQIIPLRAQRAADRARFEHMTDGALIQTINALADAVRTRGDEMRQHLIDTACELNRERMTDAELEGLLLMMNWRGGEPREYVVAGQPEDVA